jgi:hypothetical protein
VRILGWGWLLLAVVPGCLLVQPLDGAASSDDGDDSSSSAGASAAGSSGSHAGAVNSRAGATSSPGGRAGAPGAPGVSAKLAPFVGTWTVVSGTLTLTCPGVAPSSEAASGTETWAPGTVSDLVQPGFDVDCDFNANVNARTATGLPGQSCTESSTDDTSGDAIVQNFSFESFKFVVSSDGTTATQTFSGSDDYRDITSGGELICSFTEFATFTM